MCVWVRGCECVQSSELSRSALPCCCVAVFFRVAAAALALTFITYTAAVCRVLHINGAPRTRSCACSPVLVFVHRAYAKLAANGVQCADRRVCRAISCSLAMPERLSLVTQLHGRANSKRMRMGKRGGGRKAASIERILRIMNWLAAGCAVQEPW